MNPATLQAARRQFSKFFGVAALCSLAMLSGCTPEKAAAVRAAAVQFRGDSQRAIAAIQKMFDAELAAPARTDAQRSDEFAAKILSLPGEVAVDGEVIELAADPYAVKLSAQELAARAEFFNMLNEQYQAFAALFDNLEQGSLLAKDMVPKTKQHAALLTAQIAAFALVAQENPPRFIQRRTALIKQLNKARKDPNSSPDQKRQAMADLLARLDELKAQEAGLLREVMEACAVAAASGQTALTLVDSYKKLSPDDIGRMIERGAAIGEAMSGKSLGALQAQSQKALGFLQQNPEYKKLAETALGFAQQRFNKQAAK